MNIANKNRRHVVLFVLFVSWIVGQCNKSAINVAVIPMSKEFGFDSTQVGMILSSFFASYTVVTLFGGAIADKFGSRPVITTIIVLWSVFTGMTAVAWSFTSLIAIRIVFGASEGGFVPASSVAIAELYPIEKRGRAKSFLVSAAQVGVAIGTFAVAAFIASVGWRYAFWTYAVVGIIIAVVFWTMSKSDKRYDKTNSKIKSKQPLRNVLRIPLVWKLLIIQFAIGTFFFGLSSWLPSYWVQVKGLSMVEMGALTALASLVAFVFQNLSGWILDKYLVGREKILICISLAVAGCAVFFMYTAQSIEVALICLTVATTAIAVTSPVVFTLPLKYLPEELIGTGTGIVNFGQQIAGMLSPTIFGYFIHIFDGSYLWVFMFVIATVAIAFVAALTVNTNNYSGSGQPS